MGPSITLEQCLALTLKAALLGHLRVNDIPSSYLEPASQSNMNIFTYLISNRRELLLDERLEQGANTFSCLLGSGKPESFNQWTKIIIFFHNLRPNFESHNDIASYGSIKAISSLFNFVYFTGKSSISLFPKRLTH